MGIEEFRFWLNRELKTIHEKSHSPNFTERKLANLRLEKLENAALILGEFDAGWRSDNTPGDVSYSRFQDPRP